MLPGLSSLFVLYLQNCTFCQIVQLRLTIARNVQPFRRGIVAARHYRNILGTGPSDLRYAACCHSSEHDNFFNRFTRKNEAGLKFLIYHFHHIKIYLKTGKGLKNQLLKR